MKTLSLFCINVFCHGAWVMNFPWHYFLCHCTSVVCPLLSWRHNCEKHWVVLYCPITEVFFLTFCVFWEQGCLQRWRETIYAAGCSCAHEWVVEARNRTQQSVQTQTQCSRGPNPLLDTVVLTDRLRHRHVASDRNLACTFAHQTQDTVRRCNQCLHIPTATVSFFLHCRMTGRLWHQQQTVSCAW